MKGKKQIVLLLFFSLFLTVASAQDWANNIQSKNPNFFEIQEAFNDYWDDYNVVNGKYIEDGLEKKAPGWKQFKRWEWYWEQRVGPTGNFPKNTVIWDEWGKLHGQKKTKSAATNNDWSPLGPYDESVDGLGRINCIAFHPTNANIMFVGAPAGGIWKTTNGGNSWTPMADDLPALGVSSIVIHPTDPNIMYIATGDGDGSHALQAFGAQNSGDTKSAGVLKTTNGGNTWSTVLFANQEDGVLIRKLLINPNYPDFVYAATNYGIYRSSNAGLTWLNIQSGYFIDMEYKPTMANTIYAATFDNSGNAQVYVTTDGYNFSQTSNFSGINRIEIAVTPDNPNSVELLCSEATGNGLYGIYFSVNSGNTWIQYYDGSLAGHNLLGYTDDGNGSGGNGFYDLAFAIDPTDWNTMIVGGVNTFKSTNGGINWVSSNVWTGHNQYNTTGNNQVVHADKHFIAYHPLLSNTIFECNDGGLFKSVDGGNTWIDITNGMQISQLYSISSAQTNDNLISGGRQDNGSLLMNGNTEIALSGGDGMITQIDYSDQNYIYTSVQNGKIYRHHIATLSRSTISDNLPGAPLEGSWLTPYLIDPVTPTTLYAGYDEVFKSNNRGDTWTQISNFGFGKNLCYLAVANSNPNYICAGWFNGLYLTTNGGANWSNITGTLPVSNQYISSIKFDPVEENTILVTFSGYTSTEKVFTTTNAGSSWQNITLSGLPNLPVNCLEPNKNNGEIYVGTDLGVYTLNYSNNTWEPYKTNLPNAVVTDLDIQYSSSKLKAGTFGRGIWDVDVNTTFGQAPVASFTANTQGICLNDCINFTDNSTNTPTSWNWSFPGGNPSSSTQQNPSNICYTSSGNYDVTLTVANLSGTDIKTISGHIIVNNCPPIASFSSNYTTICETDCITFTDNSSNSPNLWNWRFEGGTPPVSTSQNPTICYNSEGTYNVTLTATNANGSTTDTMSNYVTVNNCTTGINSINNEENLVSIYPNPSKGVFVIENKGIENLRFVVYDIMGKIVAETVSLQRNTNTIYLPALTKGVYFIEFQGYKSKFNKKLIIE